MAIELDKLLDLEKAEQAAKEFEKEIAETMARAAGKSADEFEAFAKRAAAAIEKSQKESASAIEKTQKEVAAANEKRADEAEKSAKESAQAQIRIAQDLAREEIRASERATEEVKKAAEERGRKMEAFANDARGFIGDAGDAFGQLSKGLLGLSEQEQLVGDKMFYMTEKGAGLGGTIGGLLGPIGTLVGSGIGATVGGLLGYWSGNAENAAEKQEELAKVIEDSTIGINDYADAVEKMVAIQSDIAELGDVIIDAQSNIARVLNPDAIKKFTKEELKSSQEGAKEELGQFAKDLDTSYQNIKETKEKIKDIQKNDTYSQLKKDILIDLEKQNIENEKENVALTLKEVAKSQNELSTSTGELTRRTEEATKSRKEFDKTLKENVENMMAAQKEREELSTGLDTKGYREMLAEVGELKAEVDSLQEGEIASESILDSERMSIVKGDLRDTTEEANKLANALSGIEEAMLSSFSPVERTLYKLTGMTKDMIDVVIGFGQQMASTFSGAATKSAEAFFESIARGTRRTAEERQAARAAFFRELGTQLIADGVKNELIGVGRGILGDATGWALAAWGTGEIATGLGMGGAAARAQRRQGYGNEESTPPTGSRGSNSSGGSLGGNTSSAPPAPIIYQFYAGGAPGSTTVNAGDGPASLAQADRQLKKISSQGGRVGSGGFSRREP